MVITADKKSKRQDLDSKGIIASMYTQNAWFVNVTPAFKIDKVKFSFVMKGSKGKEAFDVYADPMIVKIWADDIRSGRFFTVLKQEKAEGLQYPTLYKFVTGENGAKHVGFMNSSKSAGYVINGKTFTDGKNKFANVPVDYIWLRTFAEWYLAALENSNWIKNHANAIISGSEAYRNELDDTDEEPVENVALPDEVDLHCEMYGEITSHKEGWRSVEIRDIETHKYIGKLWVKDESLNMAGPIDTKAKKKGDNYQKI